MYTSPYQSLKLQIVHWIPVRPHDPYHIYIGVFATLLSAKLLKRTLTDPLCLLPGFVLSLVMESLDLHDDFQTLGRGRWHESIHGLIASNLLPVVLVGYLRWGRKGT